jgi:hypothetical protein
MTPLLCWITDHVAAHMERTDGGETTIGAVAEALGVSCDEIVNAVALAGFGTWLCVLRPAGELPAAWRIFLEGE